MIKHFENRRILVVDDNRDIHSDFKKILVPSKKGTDDLIALEEDLFSRKKPIIKKKSSLTYQVDFAGQGKEALEMVEKAVAAGNPYAMAFVDMRMPPGWDGLETIEQLWKVDPHIEMVICSAYSDYSWEEIRARFGDVERVLVLKKPFEIIEIQQMAASLTTKWNLSRSLDAHVSHLEEMVEERTQEIEVQHTTIVQMEKMSALGDMANGLACEINNPLFLISMQVEDLQRVLETEPIELAAAQEFTKNIVRATTRISKVVKALLFFAGAGGKSPIEKTSTKSIIDDALVLCQEKLKINGIHVQRNKTELEIECRAAEVSQAFFNLINNAFEMLGQLEDEKWISIETKDAGDSVEFTFTDNGPTISPAMSKKVFQPLTNKAGQTIGMGLSITKSIVDNHHGKITLDTANHQTRFVVNLPKRQPMKKAA